MTAAITKIHHLNCATLCPPAQRLVNGEGSWLRSAQLICHVLLLETARDGLILIDSGLGSQDVTLPQRLPRRFHRNTRPRLELRETALAQVQALGFAPEDVRHIVVTHLDMDHAGGIADFPWARVHVHRREREAASADPRRYVQPQFTQHQFWQLYDDSAGERWRDCVALQPVVGVHAEIALLPLAGHTRGHCGVLVKAGSGSLLAAGDTYFHRHEVTGNGPVPWGLRFFAWKMAVDNALRRRNVERLARLSRESADDLQIFCAHDPIEYATALTSPRNDEGIRAAVSEPSDSSTAPDNPTGSAGSSSLHSDTDFVHSH